MYWLFLGSETIVEIKKLDGVSSMKNSPKNLPKICVDDLSDETKKEILLNGFADQKDALDCKACGNLGRPNGGYCFEHKEKPEEVPCDKFRPFFDMPCGGEYNGKKVY